MYKINAKKSVPMPKGCPQNKQTEKRDQTGPSQTGAEKRTSNGHRVALGPNAANFMARHAIFTPVSVHRTVWAPFYACVYVCVRVCVNEAKTKDTREKWPTIWH